ARYSFGVNPTLFFDAGLIRGRHVVLLVAKAVAYGAAIPVVSGFCGLRARGQRGGGRGGGLDHGARLPHDLPDGVT
ncbi:MAG TPA: hypothetical protein VH165_30875, partial [Kofleriaceae bacterium]|nr:hypothetical protein [Kofleriaceae bacterium]